MHISELSHGSQWLVGNMESKLWNTFSSTQKGLQSDFHSRVKREGLGRDGWKQIFPISSSLFSTGDRDRNTLLRLFKLEVYFKCRLRRSGVGLEILHLQTTLSVVRWEGSGWMGGRKIPSYLWEREPGSWTRPSVERAGRQEKNYCEAVWRCNPKSGRQKKPKAK